MEGTAEEKIKILLEPTDEEEAWLRGVKSLNPKEAVPVLSKILLNSQEPLLKRKMAAQMLGLLEDESAIPALTQALSAPDPVLRAKTAAAIGDVGKAGESAIARLIEALQDGDYYVRESAAKALGILKSQEALPMLARMTSVDEPFTNREVAEEAIKAIKGLA